MKKIIVGLVFASMLGMSVAPVQAGTSVPEFEKLIPDMNSSFVKGLGLFLGTGFLALMVSWAKSKEAEKGAEYDFKTADDYASTMVRKAQEAGNPVKSTFGWLKKCYHELVGKAMSNEKDKDNAFYATEGKTASNKFFKGFGFPDMTSTS